MPKNSLIGTFARFIRERVGESQDPALRVIGQVARAALPVCADCGALVLPPLSATACRVCHQTVCEEHGFFHTSGSCLCLDCLETAGIDLGREELQWADEEADDDDYSGFPWGELDIEPTRDVETIKKAYRKQARRWHPDSVAPEERANAAAMFTRLQAAYAEALRIAKGE